MGWDGYEFWPFWQVRVNLRFAQKAGERHRGSRRHPQTFRLCYMIYYLYSNIKKERTRLVYDMLLTRHVVKYLPSRFFFSIFVNFEYWLTEIKSSSIKTAACVTSVSVWFWIKERPGNGIFGFGRVRKETRAILHRPLPPRPALSLPFPPFYSRHFWLGLWLSFLDLFPEPHGN